MLDPNTLSSVSFRAETLFPLSEVQKIRYSLMAKDLENLRVQAYIEANLGKEALKVLSNVLTLLGGVS